MKDKVTLERAKEVAKLLEKKYKFGKSTCPAWFKSTCTAMEQDGSYSVFINIPSWDSISQEEKNLFWEPFEGLHIGFRVVTPPQQLYTKKEKEAKEDVVKKKKRSSHRKGYR